MAISDIFLAIFAATLLLFVVPFYKGASLQRSGKSFVQTTILASVSSAVLVLGFELALRFWQEVSWFFGWAIVIVPISMIIGHYSATPKKNRPR